ncbi:hypothetical protein K3M67_02910 [Sphingobium sp. V4]|jgi:hypothetical protein|uniref:hypothetical protein n=1 Tax=Sphingobium sp. V4 TaxID=3038927 RepID=UPI0025580F7B|nr:hypothetical protein [Sphingobium sp. V4]WIW88946.1 hypothetical protein K3M67_02910 [Sphingobium sp. V4]
MNDFFVFDLLNTCLRVAVTLIVAFKLVEFYDDYKPTERAGLGMMGSGSFLTVPPIWAYQPGQGVFDGWAVTIMTIGIILLLFGRMSRHIRHRANNAAHVRQMEAELSARRDRRQSRKSSDKA